MKMPEFSGVWKNEEEHLQSENVVKGCSYILFEREVNARQLRDGEPRID